MRINILLPPDALVGGIRVLATYARRLASRGHHVTAIQPRHPRPTFRQIVRALRHSHRWPRSPDRGPSYFDGIPTVESPAKLVAAAETATAGNRRGEPSTLNRKGSLTRIRLPHVGPIRTGDVPDGDIAIATWWETVEWLSALPAAKGLPVHFMQDYEIWGAPAQGGIARVDATCRNPIPKIVIARWVANLLATRFGQEAAAIIPNSVDTTLFTAPPRSRQRRPTVGFTYTTMHNKGADIAIQAIHLARQQIPNLKVIAFGSHAPTRQLPLPPNTDFFHRVPDRELSTLYAACDAWLFATRVEGFGLPILEAMACRTPVIGTPAGAAPELLAHGGGTLVAAEDPEAMAQALVRLVLVSDARWREISDNAFRTATSYTWDDATDRFEATLEQLLQGSSRGPSVAPAPAMRPADTLLTTEHR